MSDTEIQSWIPAFNKYISHVRRWWPRSATLVWTEKTAEPVLAWKLIFADTSDIAGALGYHDFTADGRPISYVFAADDIKYGYNPTVTATHEIAEMIADPWISQLFQITNTQFFAQEICDPCEADELSYLIDGIECSDFVTPRWFIPGSEGYVLDFAKHIDKPLKLLPGGYMSVFTSGQGWTQIYANKITGRIAKQAHLAEEKTKYGYGRLLKYGRLRPNIPIS